MNEITKGVFESWVTNKFSAQTYLYSLDRVKMLCHYYNSNQYNNLNIAFAFGPVLPSFPDYKIPVFWTDNREGKHPYFKIKRN